MKTFLKSQGISDEDATAVLAEARKKPAFTEESKAKPKPKPSPKPAAKPSAGPSTTPSTPAGEDDPANKKRKRELQFAECERIVELLRSAVKEGFTL